MKSKKVATIASTEEHVRLLIYDGLIPLDAAGEELLRLERHSMRHAIERLVILADRTERNREAIYPPNTIKRRLAMIWLAMSYRKSSV